MRDHITIQTMLVSVSDKASIGYFVEQVSQQTPHLRVLASEGSYAALRNTLPASVELIRMSDYVQEAVEQRVKSLDFKLFAGILAEDRDMLIRRFGKDLLLFDMVVCNLYPFSRKVAAHSNNVAVQAVCNEIDIGGVSLLRAAAKNFFSVAAVSSPKEYEVLAAEIKDSGGLSLRTRHRLCQQSFIQTAEYECSIAEYLSTRSFETLF